jgi:hypothetical protein
MWNDPDNLIRFLNVIGFNNGWFDGEVIIIMLFGCF